MCTFNILWEVYCTWGSFETDAGEGKRGEEGVKNGGDLGLGTRGSCHGGGGGTFQRTQNNKKLGDGRRLGGMVELTEGIDERGRECILSFYW